VPGAGDVDDARGTGHATRLPGRIPDPVQQEVGQEEVSDVVRAELQLDVLFREPVLLDHDARVVDEDVDRVELGGDARRGPLDGLLRGEVELDELRGDVGKGSLDLGDDLLDFLFGPRGENQFGLVLGGDGEGDRFAQAVWCDAGDDHCSKSLLLVSLLTSVDRMERKVSVYHSCS